MGAVSATAPLQGSARPQVYLKLPVGYPRPVSDRPSTFAVESERRAADPLPPCRGERTPAALLDRCKAPGALARLRAASIAEPLLSRYPLGAGPRCAAKFGRRASKSRSAAARLEARRCLGAAPSGSAVSGAPPDGSAVSGRRA